MGSDGGRGDAGGAEGGENGNHLLLQSLEKEVLSLRKSRDEQEETTASLLAELQRRCDKVIELEVRLPIRWRSLPVRYELGHTTHHGGELLLVCARPLYRGSSAAQFLSLPGQQRSLPSSRTGRLSACLYEPNDEDEDAGGPILQCVPTYHVVSVKRVVCAKVGTHFQSWEA